MVELNLHVHQLDPVATCCNYCSVLIGFLVTNIHATPQSTHNTFSHPLLFQICLENNLPNLHRIAPSLLYTIIVQA